MSTTRGGVIVPTWWVWLRWLDWWPCCYSPHCQLKGGHINEEGEDSDEDDITKDIKNDFNLVEKTGEPIGSNLAKINNVTRTPINKEKHIVKKLDSHPRTENLDKLKVKKCHTEIWIAMFQFKIKSKYLKTQKL